MMELQVSEMAENLIGSEIIKLAGEVKEMISKGDQIHNFTIGDFDPKLFPIPEELLEAIIASYRNAETNYPTANGMLELRKAVSYFLKTRGGLDYDTEEILISGGARPLIYATYRALVDPKDKVIFPVPSWNNNHYCHLSSAQQIIVETTPENNFMPSADELRPFISDARMIALCSPLNPTGTVFSEDKLKEICEMVVEENKRRADNEKPLYLLFDQIYWVLTHGDTLHHDPVTICPEVKPYTIFMDGLSKAFAATGVRVGWAFGPAKVMAKMKSILGHVGAWAPKAEQMATAQYLEMDTAIDTYLGSFKEDISERLYGFYKGFQDLKNKGFNVDAIAPQAAIYLTVKLDLVGKTTKSGVTLENTKQVTAFILQEAKTAIVPFYAFGASETSPWYRLSVGTAKTEEIKGFFEQLENVLSSLT
ncbi:MAG: aspartate aminotransferase [Flavobacteriales bacterium]|jgi:aspartate aminotransferase